MKLRKYTSIFQHIFFIFFFSGFSLTSLAQSEYTYTSNDAYYLLEGAVGAHPIIVHLNQFDRKIRGSVLFQEVPLVFMLEGSFNEDSMVLNVDDFQNHTQAHLQLVSTESGKWSGFWADTNNENSRKVSLSLKKNKGLQLDCFSYKEKISYFDDNEMPFCTFEKKVIEINKKNQVLSATQLFFNRYFFQAVKLDVDYQKQLLKEHRNFIENYRSELSGLDPNEILEMPSLYTSIYIENTSVLFNDKRFLNIESTAYQFSGGAHGMYSVDLISYDLQKKKQLTESDIFIDGFEKKMADVLKRKIASINYFSIVSELNDSYFVDQIIPNGNFLIFPSGILYLFNEYEIASYSNGITRVYIPYNEIETLLKKGNIIRK